MLQKVGFFLIQFERQKRNWPTNRPELLDSLPSANTSNVSPLLALWEAVYSQASDCTLDFHRLQMMTITFWEKFLEQRDHNDTGFQIALAWPSTDPALKAYFLLTAMLMIIKICPHMLDAASGETSDNGDLNDQKLSKLNTRH